MREWLTAYCMRRAKHLTVRATLANIDGDDLAKRHFLRLADRWSARAKWLDAIGKNAVTP